MIADPEVLRGRAREALAKAVISDWHAFLGQKQGLRSRPRQFDGEVATAALVGLIVEAFSIIDDPEAFDSDPVLRAPQNDGAAAMREACAIECEEVSNERWGYTEKFVIKGLHDKAAVESGAVGGASECAERIRALTLAQPDRLPETATGGESE